MALSIIIVCLTFFYGIEAVTIKFENSLSGPFDTAGEGLLFWDMSGSSQITNTYIRLTTDEQGKQGSIWNNFPSLYNSWEFQTHFHIHGKGINLNGDGMAIWYVKDTLHAGTVFGSKDYFTGLGVFIDTFENQKEPHKHRHPYISAMVNNGSLHYEHSEDGTMTEIGGCHANIRNLEVPTKIAVSYINNNIGVYLDIEGNGVWTPCFTSFGVHLPTGYSFGISASTSEYSDNHDIISITTLNLDPTDKKFEDTSDILPYAENVHIPQKYHKATVEKEERHEEPEKHKEGEHVQHVKEVKEEEQARSAEQDAQDKADTDEQDSVPQSSTSWFKMFIYIVGASILIVMSVSMYNKYSERKRERMQKRLF